jgi:hypothetical protein
MTPQRRATALATAVAGLVTAVMLGWVGGTTPAPARAIEGALSSAVPVTVTETSMVLSTPSVAALGDRVWVAWDEYDPSTQAAYAYVAASDDRGGTFSAPVRVSDDPAAENPDLAVDGDGNLVLAHLSWAAQDVNGFWPAWIVVHRSEDGGATWHRAGQAPSAEVTWFQPAPGSLTLSVSDSGSGVLVSWVDLAPPGVVPEDHPTKVTGTESTPVWFARSADGGATFAAPEPAVGSSCSCCRPHAAFVGERAAIAYRDLTFIDASTDERDPAVALQAADGAWDDPIVVHDDGYQLPFAGCPASGPGIDADGETMLVAWYTGADDRGRIQVASGTEAAGFAPPIELAETPVTYDLQVAAEPDHAAVLYLTEAGSTDGSPLGDANVVELGPDGIRSLGSVRVPWNYIRVADVAVADGRTHVAWIGTGEDAGRVLVATTPGAAA